MAVDTTREWRSILSMGLMPISVGMPYGISPSDEPGLVPTAGSWVDTGGGFSLVEDDTLFTGDGTIFGTDSATSNIHSHWDDAADENTAWLTYTLYAEVRINEAGLSSGVTFLSKYPTEDKYYGLISPLGGSFRVIARGAGVISGTSDTGIIPSVGSWMALKVYVYDDPTAVPEPATRIKVKVWPLPGDEPASWSVECFDDGSARLTSGKIGLWSSE